MRRGLFIAIGLLAFTGCGGEIGTLPNDADGYGFDALVNATPDKVQPGQWVKFEVQLKSESNRPVEVNLTLRLIEDATGKLVYTQNWEALHFELGEVYGLTQNYLTATDIGRSAHHVELEARAVDSGEVVWTRSDVTRIDFGI